MVVHVCMCLCLYLQIDGFRFDIMGKCQPASLRYKRIRASPCLFIGGHPTPPPPHHVHAHAHTKLKAFFSTTDAAGHHFVHNMKSIRQALDSLTLERHGVDGKRIYVYGEVGEVWSGEHGRG